MRSGLRSGRFSPRALEFITAQALTARFHSVFMRHRVGEHEQRAPVLSLKLTVTLAAGRVIKLVTDHADDFHTVPFKCEGGQPAPPHIECRMKIDVLVNGAASRFVIGSGASQDRFDGCEAS